MIYLFTLTFGSSTEHYFYHEKNTLYCVVNCDSNVLFNYVTNQKHEVELDYHLPSDLDVRDIKDISHTTMAGFVEDIIFSKISI